MSLNLIPKLQPDPPEKIQVLLPGRQESRLLEFLLPGV
jgi:hypothetical protein